MSIVYASCEINRTQKKLDEKGREWIPFLITSNNIDPAGDKVHPKGIITERYVINNIVLYMHDYQESIGLSYLEDTDDGVIAWAWFDEIGELSQKVKRKVDAGTLNAASIGLSVIQSLDRVPTPEEKMQLENMPYIKKVTDILKSQLIEWSVVTIPLNPKTLVQRAMEKGFDNSQLEMLKKSYGIIEMENETPNEIQKAGSVLSKSNMTKLSDAAKLITDVLESAMPKEPSDDDEPMMGKSLEPDIAKIAELTDENTKLKNIIQNLKVEKNEKLFKTILGDV